jgi:hypothetical protein
MTPNESPEAKKARVEQVEDADGVTADDLFPETYLDHMQVELDAEAADALTRLYLQRRIRYQASYYEQRAVEYESNSDLAFRAGAILMTLSSLLASIGVVSTLPIYALLTALIPALASFIATFRQLYQWDRQKALYRDTLLGLERARIILPDLDLLTPDEARKVLPKLIETTEGVLEKEVAQWGQIAMGKGDEDEDGGDLFQQNQEVLVDSAGDRDALGGVSSVLGADVGSLDESQTPLAPSGAEMNTVDAMPEPTAPVETTGTNPPVAETVEEADTASDDVPGAADETDMPVVAENGSASSDADVDDDSAVAADDNTDDEETDDMTNIKSVG